MEDGLSDEYSQEMQQRMGGALTYRHEDGINYDEILDDLIVGSCPQTPQDIDRCGLPPQGTSRNIPSPTRSGFNQLAILEHLWCPSLSASDSLNACLA